MQAFLETDRAIALARDMAAEMLRTDSFSFPPSEQYKLSSLNKNTMFGIMICNDINGNEKILRAFSGALNGEYRIPGYVNPCFSVTEFRKIEAEYSPLIHRADEDERKRLSAECLGKINALYSFSTWDGSSIGLPDKAPTGTGDCAGLRLINTALRKNLEIMGLAEFMIGDDGTIETYPPCKERCSLLLPSMLGLDILYADESIAVINKEAGMLSVPGRGEDKLDSASYRFHKLFPSSPKECFVHRLDMDTSGLLVMAFTKDAHRKLSMAAPRCRAQAAADHRSSAGQEGYHSLEETGSNNRQRPEAHKGKILPEDREDTPAESTFSLDWTSNCWRPSIWREKGRRKAHAPCSKDNLQTSHDRKERKLQL